MHNPSSKTCRRVIGLCAVMVVLNVIIIVMALRSPTHTFRLTDFLGVVLWTLAGVMWYRLHDRTLAREERENNPNATTTIEV